ncbi:MAG TPA: hypothetical protein VKE26_10285 [Xanthobacteraceae bacterium]|nr:hypothetical protein [Xanthobacteraceae bacterium]
MTRITPSLFVSTLLLCLPLAPAEAQLARTFVSAATGNDANNCDRPTPCRTFQVAHNNTLANGEITVLDPGGYGAVSINKTISIINDGVGEAGTLVSGGLIGISISAGAADTVSLRGLTVKGIGFGGGNGIVFNSGKSLTIENCSIRNLTGAMNIGNGILFQPSAISRLAISNTFVADNSQHGIWVAPIGMGMAKVVLNHVETYDNSGNGIFFAPATNGATIKATVMDSMSSNNSGSGIVASSGIAGSIDVTVIRSTVANNDGAGLSSLGLGARIRFGLSSVIGNGTGLLAGNAFLDTYQDNNVAGNTSNGAVTGVVNHQ